MFSCLLGFYNLLTLGLTGGGGGMAPSVGFISGTTGLATAMSSAGLASSAAPSVVWSWQ